MKGVLLEGKETFRLYLFFNSCGFPESSYIKLAAHALQTVQAWLQSVRRKDSLLREKTTFSSILGVPVNRIS
jgi:hypothetical protein